MGLNQRGLKGERDLTANSMGTEREKERERERGVCDVLLFLERDNLSGQLFYFFLLLFRKFSLCNNSITTAT